MSLIEQGIEQGLIRFDDDKKNIFYIHQNKRRNFNNPEEQVQAEAFLKLVLEYGYPVERVQQFVAVKMGVATKEADIVVYKDNDCTQPYIVVECKSQEISELEFQEAIKQAFSYANALAGTTKFIWVTKGNKEDSYSFDKERNKKTIISEIPYYGETDTKKYKYSKGGFYFDKVKGQLTKIKTGDLKVVTESELTRVFKQAHDVLWGGGKRNESEAFDEFDKLVFCKVWDEKETDEKGDGEPYQFQVVTEQFDMDDKEAEAKSLEALRKRIFAIYEKGKAKDPQVFNKEIDLEDTEIKAVVEYLQGINFLETDLDSKGKAFETFLGGLFRGKFGAFFTPRNIVQFVVDVLPMTHESRVLDTSCGSGGFLLYCLDKIRKQADKKYNVSLPKEAVKHYKHWHNFASNNLFGIEINDQIARTAKMNMIIHDDGHTNVVSHDGLYEIEQIAKNTENQGFIEEPFNFIVTNPPFGSIAKQSEQAYMKSDANTAPYYDFSLKEINWIEAKVKDKHTATGRESQSTEILFIEQCHKFLAVGGYLGIVIPDGILTNSSLQYVRDGIEERFRIIAVVSLPQTAFMNTGAGVKSSVLFLKKYSEAETEQLKQFKQDLQDRLAAQTNLVELVNDWDKQKKDLIKRGDAVCQQIDADLKAELKALKQRDELTAEIKKQKENEAKALRKAHEKTEAFIEWKKAVSDEYNDKINQFKEELEEQYQAEKQAKLGDYPIFMAIAENIGYDATGRSTNQLLSREEVKNANGEAVIVEVYRNDLFDIEVKKRWVLEKGKFVEEQFQESIVAGTGINGALTQFIEEVEAGKK